MTDTSIYTDPTNMTKDNVQLSIWNGTKWVELSNGLTINQINANIGAVQDAVKDAQSGIAQAAADAQNAVDTANDTATKVDGKVDDTTYQSGIAQLASDINLRVKSDDLLSQINIESGNILIQSNKIFLDASSVTFGGTAFITSAMVASLSADDIVTGTMTAGAINLGNGTFSVDTNGNLIANDATLTGTLISGTSDSYNYEVSSTGIIFKQGTTAFATLEGFAYGSNEEYVGLMGDSVSIGRVSSDTLSGSYAYTNISTQDGIVFERGNPFNSSLASSSISVGKSMSSGIDAVNLTVLNEEKKVSAVVNIYGYDAQNNKDTESIYMAVIDSNSKSSSVNIDSTGILLDSPNTTLDFDNSVTLATTFWSSEPNGIQISTTVGAISVTSETELDLTAESGNVSVSAPNGNFQITSGGLVNTAGGSHIRNTQIDNELWVNGKLEATSLAVSGSKNSIVKTSQGWTLINAYETAEYYFGDIGKTNTGSGATVKVMMDSLYLETVNTSIPYHVFVSSYGNGYAWVSEQTETYFIINSSVPNLEISYEVKAKRLGYEGNRLEIDTDYDSGHANVGV